MEIADNLMWQVSKWAHRKDLAEAKTQPPQLIDLLCAQPTAPLSVQVDTDEPIRENETRPFRNARYKDALIVSDPENPTIFTLRQLWQTAVRNHRDKLMFARRRLLRVIEEQKTDDFGHTKTFFVPEFAPELEWFTYGQTDDRVRSIALALRQFTGLRRGLDNRMAIFCETCMEWQMTAQALIQSGIEVVTLYATLTPSDVQHCLEQTGAQSVLVDSDNLHVIKDIKAHLPALTHVIYVQRTTSSVEKTQRNVQDLRALGLLVASFEDLENLVASSALDDVRVDNIQPEDVAMIMYTSGTTGTPKGVIMTHRNIVSAVFGVGFGLDAEALRRREHVYLAYLPLAHILEFLAEQVMLYCGFKICYGSPRTLTSTNCKPFGDLEAFKPTIFACVPRVLETVRKTVHNKIADSWVKKTLFEKAFEAKSKAVLQGHRDTPIYNRLVFDKMRHMMGGNIQIILSGGAPLAADTQIFSRVCIAPTLQGYGLSETCAASAVCPIGQPFLPERVGVVAPSVEIKLVAEPEMGYTVNKDEPEGEIWIRGPSVCTRGYYKMEQKTAEDFTPDGWFKTGDIGRMDRLGYLQIIDRKKHLVKLDSGEYISLERIEGALGGSPYSSPNGTFVYANSHRSFPVALVQVDEQQVLSWAKHNGFGHVSPNDQQAWNDLLNQPALRQEVLRSMNQQASHCKLHRSEYVRNVRLVSEPWTPENGLLTASNKFKRNVFQERFKDVFAEMYQESQQSEN